MNLPAWINEIRPRQGFGLIRFGNTKSECRSLLGAAPEQAEGFADMFGALTLAYGKDGRLRRARFYGALGANPRIGDKAVLSLGVDEAVEALTAISGPPRVSDLSHYWFKDLGVVLWRHASDIERFTMLELQSKEPLLDAAEGALEAKDLAILASDPLVTKLELRDKVLSSTALEGLRGSSIKKLGLDNTCISDEALEPLGECQNLEYLTLDGTPITDAGLRSLGSLSKLSFLTINYTGMLGWGLGALASCPLRSLQAAKTRISSEHGSAIGRLQHLERLVLNYAPIDDRMFSVLKTLPSLVLLEVRYCRSITAGGVEEFRSAVPRCRVESNL